MKKVIIYVFIITLMVVSSPFAGATKNKPVVPNKSYVIGPGDVLMISVWKEEALTQDVVVQPDGKITFPLIGSIVVTNKSPDTVRKEIANKLKSYVPDPILTVSVRQINSLMIYVVGKVHQSGRFVLNSNVNVLQALAMAGGLNSFANGGKIKIFRETSKGTRIFNFDYDDVSAGEHLEQNIGLVRGDVIVVR